MPCRLRDPGCAPAENDRERNTVYQRCVGRGVGGAGQAGILREVDVARAVVPVLDSPILMLLFRSKLSVFQISIQHAGKRQQFGDVPNGGQNAIAPLHGANGWPMYRNADPAA